jgi:hypothetical protein
MLFRRVGWGDVTGRRCLFIANKLSGNHDTRKLSAFGVPDEPGPIWECAFTKQTQFVELGEAAKRTQFRVTGFFSVGWRWFAGLFRISRQDRHGTPSESSFIIASCEFEFDQAI